MQSQIFLGLCFISKILFSPTFYYKICEDTNSSIQIRCIVAVTLFLSLQL